MSLFDRPGMLSPHENIASARDALDWGAARNALMAWYRENARQLPWRENRTPYRVWVSEIMLQQTTVPTVLGFFDRFLATFPDVGTLAKAPIDQVLKQWEGLGYYQRARNLHRAAGIIAERGRFPEDLEGWMALPGVGRSTAGAICSIALGQAEPILDANVRRVQRRFLQEMDGQDKNATLLWESSLRFVTGAEDPGMVNQALMELGARICLLRSPRCTQCPVSLTCLTAVTGRPPELPVSRSPERPIRIRTAIIPGDGSRLCFVQGNGRRLLQGLWDFLSLEGEPVSDWPRLVRLNHVYTHFREEVHVVRVEMPIAHDAAEGLPVRWVSLAQARELPLTGVARKILSFLENGEIGKQV
ncbi:MAG: A/G-specific adenine glycosylase [Leptospirales bacterium]